MKFRSTLIAAGLLAVASAAQAANPHYIHGEVVTCAPPSADVTGSTYNWSCTDGLVAGLGNQDIQVVVSYTASAGTFCHNKGNPANIVPGQNPAIAVGSQAVGIPQTRDKNGSVVVPELSGTFNVSTPSPSAAGCPNSKWTVTMGPVAWTAHYSFQQPPGTELPGLSFDF